MKAIEKISQELLDNLQSAYITNISLGDEDKNQVSGSDNTELARNFAFNFVVDGVNLGTVLITLNSNAKSLEVQFDHDMLKKAQAESPELQIKAKKAWFDFLRKMRKFTSTTPDMTFDIINLTQKNLRKDSDMYTVDELKEGKMSKLAGSAKSSYQRVGENRIIIRHIGPIDEEKMGSRTRNIKSIYIENPAGERFLVKENSLIGARILAHHLSAGGNLMDDFSNHLYTMIREMRDLRSFVMSSRNKVFESDDANIMVEAATEYYKTLRETVRSLSTGRGYSRYLESFEPEQTTEVMDTQGLKEKFIVRSFNEKFEAALPHIAKAYQKKIQEQNQLYSAAQDYIDGNKAFGLTEADVMLYKTLKFESGQALSKKVLEHISAMLSTTDQTVSKFASESAVKFSTITETPESQTWLHQDLAMNLVKSFVAEMNNLNEKPLNPYAIGMAQAMKSTGDEPPLKKSTIKKAHHIADVISKEQGMAEGSAEIDKPQTPPFEPSKSTFKKNNPNRTPRDSVKALAQRGIQTNTNKDTEPVKQGVAEGLDNDGYGYKSLSTEQIMKLIRSGNWEAMSDIKPGRHLQLRNSRNGKTTTIHVKQSVAESARRGDDWVGFSVDSERAYEALMDRYGDLIDHDEDSGIMYAPRKIWNRIEQVAYDADGIGAIEDNGWENPEHYGVAEGSQTVGHEILGMLRQINRQGDDAMEELYSSCPLLAQFWDQYEGDFRSMVIELSPKTLNRIKAEISAFNQQGVAEEGPKLTESEAMQNDKMFTDTLAMLKKYSGI